MGLEVVELAAAVYLVSAAVLIHTGGLVSKLTFCVGPSILALFLAADSLNRLGALEGLKP